MLWKWNPTRKGEVSYGKDQDGKPRDGFDFFLERGNFAEDVKQSGSKTLPPGNSSSNIRL